MAARSAWISPSPDRAPCARALAADDVTVSIAGSGDAGVQAAKTLAVSIARSGSVEYSGAAQLTRSAVAGSGSIRQRR